MDIDPDSNVALATGCAAVVLVALKGLLWVGVMVALIYWLVSNA